MSQPFIAEIKIFAGNFAPRNWAFCNGQLLPIAQNTALFSLVGTIYGGDGRTTFGLPNLQGRAPVHAGRGPGLTDRRLGQTGGTTTVTLTAQQLASHDHTMVAFSEAEVANPTSTRGLGAAPMYSSPANVGTMASGALGNTGGGGAHENRQPRLGLNFVIALVGVFPSRS